MVWLALVGLVWFMDSCTCASALLECVAPVRGHVVLRCARWIGGFSWFGCLIVVLND